MIGATFFSGIGAPEVAMPDWRWAWHAEIEKFPAAVMAARHPHSINLGDVTADDFAERAAATARPDILVFGSPCQSFSVAGKRLGMDDARGNLALIALGIIDRLKPGWFVFENVPGLLSSAEGRDFGLFLRTVDEIGYSLCWSVLDAQYFGVAQRRQRVFAVGYLGDWRYPAAVLLEPESLCGDHPPRRKARQGIAVSPTLRAGGNRTGGDRPPGTDVDTADSLIVAGKLSAARGAACANAADLETYIPVAHALRADGFDASEDGTGRGTPLVPVAYRTSGNCGAWETGDKTDALTTATDPNSHVLAFSSKDHGADAGELAPTLRAMGHTGSHANAGGQVAVAFQASQSGFRSQETHATLDANNGSRRHNGVAVGSMVRRLTPRECERLQGFPDDYTMIDYRGKPAADGPRYKALGNSMAVPKVRWILQRIEKVSLYIHQGQETK